MLHDRSKHTHGRYHFVVLHMVKVFTLDNDADMLTKPLPTPKVLYVVTW